MDCPRCGLSSPDTAIWCECGHDFETGRLRGDPALAAPAWTGQFISAAARARWTIALLAVWIFLDVVAIVSDLAQAGLVTRALSGAPVTRADAASNDSRQYFIAVLQLIVYVATAVAFLMWFSRSYSNVSVLSTTPRSYSSAWAVGSFFIPFLNLVRPFRITRELWQLSDADAPRWKTPPVLGWWWGVWLLSGALGQLALMFSRHARSPQDLLTVSYLSIASNAGWIAAAALAIAVVKGIEAAQVRHPKAVERSTFVRVPAPGVFGLSRRATILLALAAVSLLLVLYPRIAERWPG